MFLKDWFTRGSDILETNAFEQTQKSVQKNPPQFYRIRIYRVVIFKYLQLKNYKEYFFL